MTENGPCYRSDAFKETCSRLGLRHLRTRPYTPRTNGKAERFIQSVGHVGLTQAWGIPTPSLARKQAIVSVPSNDTEYDQVYVHLETGSTYRVPFTSLIWEPIAEERLPDAVVGFWVLPTRRSKERP
jgi:transposase InsO family protein